MKNKLTLLIVMFFIMIPSLFSSNSFADSAKDLLIITEEYPPFNFKKDGKLQGISIDLIMSMYEKMGLSIGRRDIKLWPWARGYKSALTKKNTCLFSTTRTEERDKLFKWVGPIAPTQIVLVAKKSKKIKINSLSDVKAYKVGVVRDDVGEQLLTNGGVGGKSIDRTPSLLTNIKKLNAGRLDMISYEENVTSWTIKSAGLNPDDYETVYVLKKSELFFTLHKDTDSAIAQKLQKALDDLKSSGDYQRILDTYLK